MFSISKNPQASMAEVLAKAEKYINGEEALISKNESSSTHKEKSGTDKRRGRSPKRQIDRERTPKKDGERSPKMPRNLRDRLGPPPFERRRRYLPQRFTPLTASVSQVLHEVRNEQFLRWLTQMKSDPTKRDNTKYCEFHRDYGHRTDDCIQLKREIEYLIRRGYLRRFISSENQHRNQAHNQAPPQQPPSRQTTTQHQQSLGEIQVISRGFACGGESMSRLDSRPDPIGGSEPSSGCETQDWDSFFFFFLKKPTGTCGYGPHPITESKYYIHITESHLQIQNFTFTLQIRARNLHVANPYKCVGPIVCRCLLTSSPVPTRIKNPC